MTGAKVSPRLRYIVGNRHTPGPTRVFIVGFREPTHFTWDWLTVPAGPAPTLAAILHPEEGTEAPEPPFTGELGRVNPKYILTDKLWAYPQRYAEKHHAAGNGFGFGLVGVGDVARTLSARYHKDGSEILIKRGRGNPRRLTPRECARMMGFDDPARGPFAIPVSDTQAYRQFGNAVVVPVLKVVAGILSAHVQTLKSPLQAAA